MSVMVPAEKAVATKRGVLAKLAKIYDPLGVVSPMMLSGKLVYRAFVIRRKPGTRRFQIHFVDSGTSGEANFRKS